MLPVVVVVVSLLAQSQAAPPKIDLVKAKRVFDASCAGCHGPEGRGGKGPPLAVPKLKRVRSDEELGAVILGGIPGTQMPPSWYLGPEGVTLAATYVRVLGAKATLSHVAGDVAKGKALYEGKGGCTGCHSIGSSGRAFGPDLSDIGARRSAENLSESIVDPSAEIAEGFAKVQIVTRQGARVSGVRINEDTFTIQIMEPSGAFRSFRKAELSQLEKHLDESAMPS